MLPQKLLGFLSFVGQFWGYFRQYRRLELEHFNNAFAMNLRAQRKVTVVLTANTYSYIEIKGAYGPRYSEDTDS